MIEPEIDKDMCEYMEPIWSLLSPEEKALLKSHISTRHFKKNEIIYHENDEAEYLMCLICGKVKIYKEGIGGRNQIMRLVSPIQYFGYRAYFAKEPYVTEAAAFENATILFVPMDVITRLIHLNSQVAMFFISELASDLGESDERTVNLTQKHIRGRLADSLLFLLDKYGTEDDGITLNIYLAREDLANLSNMTTSNAIRTLSGFCSEGIIIADGRKIKIMNEEKLRMINKFG
ncbi:MAG: Crp/Fnr family transcriptional regulator [Bacteroidales bacterium]